MKTCVTPSIISSMTRNIKLFHSNSLVQKTQINKVEGILCPPLLHEEYLVA